jgi:hypothetical protein
MSEGQIGKEELRSQKRGWGQPWHSDLTQC